MKKLFYIFFLSIVIISCSPISWSLIGNGNIMKNSYDDIFSEYQFDSICVHDSLPIDLNLWLSVPMKDYEDNMQILKYMYIKKMDSLEIIYIINKQDDKYNISKRITQ